jgi:exopolyphosphatase/guanosine-5'-triphosphate,3'-diphosphate pyrophosphatase
MTASETVAAIDLGSNSFHMLVTQVTDGHVKVVDRMREMVRLAGGLDERNLLTAVVMDRAIDCLQRFGQRLRSLPAGSVRAVGTNTLRKARNSAQFLARAEQALGHRIDIISGHEEARLIYLGVSHSLEDDGKRRLVVDIGGGSTELILGRTFHPQRMESLHMGCVSMSLRFFPDGVITADGMRAAEIHALQELESVGPIFRAIGWETAIGASGSVLAIHEAVVGEGWGRNGITAAGLKKLSKALVAAGHTGRVRIEGVTEERAPVFPGGVAILSSVFEALGVEQMGIANGALREGLIYDLIGRIQQDDIRERTVIELGGRYQIDVQQAGRVQRQAVALFDRVATAWRLHPVEHRQLLGWAAYLHEIGLSISHSQYHKHGGYLLYNLDMPGFSRGEQQRLACLVRSHRRKFPAAEFEVLPEEDAEVMRRLAVLLRLAVLAHRGRDEGAFGRLDISAGDDTIRIRFPSDWLANHPLTQADLEQEAEYLRVIGFRLKCK